MMKSIKLTRRTRRLVTDCWLTEQISKSIGESIIRELNLAPGDVLAAKGIRVKVAANNRLEIDEDSVRRLREMRHAEIEKNFAAWHAAYAARQTKSVAALSEAIR